MKNKNSLIKKGIGINYFIAYRKRAHESPLDEFSDLTKYKILKNPFKFWCADPFLFTFKGKDYIFAELANKYTCRGCIGFCCLNDSIKTWKIAIKEEWHLSFPNIFIEDNEIYMMCESSAIGKTYIYKCVEFPYKWEIFNPLFLEGQNADSIFLNDDLRLFYTYEENVNDNCYAKLYNIDNSNGQLLKKIKDPNHFLRPGGKSFLYNDRNYLVTQDSSKTYGYGLYIMSVDLNSLSFQTVLHKTADDFNLIQNKITALGMHTFNFNNNYVTIDILEERFLLYKFIMRIIAKLKRHKTK